MADTAEPEVADSPTPAVIDQAPPERRPWLRDPEPRVASNERLDGLATGVAMPIAIHAQPEGPRAPLVTGRATDQTQRFFLGLSVPAQRPRLECSSVSGSPRGSVFATLNEKFFAHASHSPSARARRDSPARGHLTRSQRW